MTRIIAAGLVAIAGLLMPQSTRSAEEALVIDKSKICAPLEPNGPRYCVLPEQVLDAIGEANHDLARALAEEIKKRKDRCTAKLEVLPKQRI